MMFIDPPIMGVDVDKWKAWLERLQTAPEFTKHSNKPTVQNEIARAKRIIAILEEDE